MSGVAVSACVTVRAHGGRLSTFCDAFMVQFVKLMQRIFEFVFLLFDCFVCRQTVPFCLKRFTKNGHYTGEVEDIIIGRLTVVS